MKIRKNLCRTKNYKFRNKFFTGAILFKTTSELVERRKS